MTRWRGCHIDNRSCSRTIASRNHTFISKYKRGKYTGMSRVPVILLKVLSGPDHGQEKRFRQYCVRLGRDYRNDFVLSDRFVSGRHGKFVWESGSLIYYDLQSRHGTAVSTSLEEAGQVVERSIRLQDQYKVSRYPVSHGAQLLLGSTLLMLTLEKGKKSKDEDTFEEQASVRSSLSTDELSLLPSSMGELTANHSPYSQSGDQHTASQPFTLTGSGVMATQDFLPASQPPPTSVPPTSVPATASSDTLLYQEPFRPGEDHPSGDSDERETLAEGLKYPPTPIDKDMPFRAGLHVPEPGPAPRLPTSTLLTPTIGQFASEPGGALSENIRKGLTETFADVDMEHMLLGATGAHSAWGQTQPAAPALRQDNLRIEPFPDGDISKFATANASGEELGQRIDGKDPRMEMLFQLTGKLNRLNHIDDILSHIVDATFDTLNAAQFFAICLLNEEGEFVPYLSRMPGGISPEDEKVTLSQSLLQEVAEKREAVLFVRDRMAKLSQSIIDAEIWSCLCAPLIGQKSLLGVMLVDTRQKGSLFTPQDLNLFSILSSSAAFALERAHLTSEIVRMFEGFVEASVTAIEARDPTTAGHSQRVATYTIALAEAVNEVDEGDLVSLSFSREELVELRYAALLHDMGKVGVRESVLNKASRLTDETMSVIHQRFETFKAFSSQLKYEKLFRRLQKESRPPRDEELKEILSEQETLGKELTDIFQWINKIRFAEYLNDEVIERLQSLSHRNVTLGEHQKVPLLLEQELTDLHIRRGTLNDEEWENMRSHAALSQSYLERIPWSSELQRIPCIAGAHHEKLDGSGYPDGLKGEQLLPQVRILTIADIFDALTAWDRPYRKAASIDKAMNILVEEADMGKLDKRLVRAFAERVLPKLSLPQQEAPTSQPTNTGDYSLFMPEK